LNWIEYEKIIELVEHPENHLKTIGKEIIFNKRIITTDIQMALEAFHESEYRQFGRILAQGLKTLDGDLSN
jgi:hypothetical protein